MGDTSYATGFTVDATPQQVFDAVINVRGWWAEDIEGGTAKAGDEFIHRYGDMQRCKIRVTEAVPGKKVSWLVVENYFSFTKDETEWTGTTMTFDIGEKAGRTELSFTHQGLVPAYECYDMCSNAWGSLIAGSLKDLVATGEDEPVHA
ncbi:SRPBCC family protein [Saccharothrix isguenensis]